MGEFTHFNEQGHAVMVDVSEKSDTVREATAMGRISMSQECFEKVKTGGMKKGDVLGTARIAGIMGAKRTSKKVLWLREMCSVWPGLPGSWEQSVLPSLFRCATS